MALAMSQISFPLEIPNISELDSGDSSEVVLLNIPWRISICTEFSGGEQWLGAFLYCTEQNQMPEWTCPAYFAVKLKSSDENKPPIKYRCDPYVFNQSGRSFGNKIIEWRHLTDPTEGYVKNDAIKLDIKIRTVEQNCELLFDALDWHYENSSTAKFLLTVTNVNKLMAVRTTEFDMKNSPWTLTVYKSSSAHLAVRLESMLQIDDVKICIMRATFKLLPFAPNKNPIKIVQTSAINNGRLLESKGIISWKDLFNHRSTYVENNMIRIEVEMEANPRNNMAIDNNLAKKSRLECAVCLKSLQSQDLSSTVCGHLLCLMCLEESIKTHKCKKSITDVSESVKLFLNENHIHFNCELVLIFR